jgi:hypothetical protein
MQQPTGSDGRELMPSTAHTTRDIPCIQRFQAHGSMKESVRQMHLDYGRYHKHTGRIVTERKSRREA